ncbi:MAG: hypothetical protein CVV64_17900 [Candidatus Wallbacteria bacterium HGW-Wallbacteria-1]|jgi:GNAT superfamily N-acetyltransferase|uniref:N-acetyltransferase domain-containing protein n=1 Tax=Candidatus Wallbacteria bacterium HGW-Wallbacteria-1 TaxID=2013854 RepID=A0A2N1PJW5_9BACT|nr:MAG: hypothetical protein CVV64_17900 [Candidatus Wallbacteria bacterium HGW-Wallbacteria-1]
MMLKPPCFTDYYSSFLCLPDSFSGEGKRVFQSSLRDIPINGRYLYSVIFTEWNGFSICSTAPEFHEICRNLFDGSSESVMRIFRVLSQDMPELGIDSFRRYFASSDSRMDRGEAVQLTPGLVSGLKFNSEEESRGYILRKGPLFEQGRQFAIIKDRRIASTAFLSDISGDAANIVVYTSPEFRGLGLGRQTVAACVEWCRDQRLIPIYLVRDSNVGSVRLAESLGMVLGSFESIITDRA